MDRVLRLNKPKEPETRERRPPSRMLNPARKVASTDNIVACNLHFESFSDHRVEFYLDFLRKVAEVMRIPCSGTIGLPTHVQRWTVNKSPFVHKGAQENFARLRVKRMLQIKDTHPDTLRAFLAYIEDNMPAGVSMRTHQFEYQTLQDASREAEEVKAAAIKRDAQALQHALTDPKSKAAQANPLQQASPRDVRAIAEQLVAQMRKNPTSDIDQVAREIIRSVRPDAVPPVPAAPQAPKAAKEPSTKATPTKRK
ncbi:mitochondrial 37S ribosomal protein rsm10 [Tieghemiomyces parasiticus]|uniref:Mitochondrial 37S ribosomal protein rsm10 n=1 Tax=Tieghemiomyces parasiticus TaxID=78921 RepID=A0A9W8AAP4_9FUNG|nr:mitochondrial 37S ribosomal protein rsm10 [Tieghemiomyces parasiticus]